MAAIAGVHPVREALRARRAIGEVLIQEGDDQRCGDILELCRRAGIAVRRVPRSALDRLSDGAVHQGVVAMVAAHKYSNIEDLIDALEAPGLLVVLDGVEDPHNLGAIIRTAHAAGAAAVIVPERRAAGITPVAAKAAAGALEYLPVCRVTNINRTLDMLKEKDYWVVGLDERAAQGFRDIDYRGGCVLVLGAEGHGLHQLVKQKCDFLARIPMDGAVASLNVSVAAGIVLFEAARQRRGG